jgi:hypothetical protein
MPQISLECEMYVRWQIDDVTQELYELNLFFVNLFFANFTHISILC